MKCLSIQQPWAWLIVNGYKDIENRDWKYPPKFRGRFLVHAGIKFDVDGADFIRRERPDIRLPFTYDMGGIVGEATLVDVVTESDSPWFFGRLGFVLRDQKALPFRAMRGQLGFFPVKPPAAPGEG